MPRGAFIGRVELLDQLQREVGTAPLTTILGTAGTGKSRLSVELARRTNQRVRWVAGRATDALGRLKSEPSLLLVVDGLVDAGRARPALRRLIEGGARILVSSRDLVALPEERVFVLGPLSQQESLAMVVDRLGDRCDDALRAELVDLTDGLPGAIDLVARCARTRDIHAVCTHLRSVVRRERESGRRLPRSALMELFNRWSMPCRGRAAA